MPITGLSWILLLFFCTNQSLIYLFGQAIGSLTIAAMTHRIYVAYDFVERGDPALAWLSMVFLLLLMPRESLPFALRSWAALFLLLAAVDQILQVHRQASTSGLQFRIGALSALSVCLEPFHLGFILGVGIILAISRPFTFREWAMLALGIAWVGVFLGSALVFYPDQVQAIIHNDSVPIAENTAARLISPFVSRVWLISLAIWGAFFLFREKSKISLRAQTTRLNLMILFCVTLLIALLIHPSNLPVIWENRMSSFDPNTLRSIDKLFAVGISFGVVGLIPFSQRNHGKSEKWGVLRMLVILVSLLILFIPSF